jgi:hypothetical protein
MGVKQLRRGTIAAGRSAAAYTFPQNTTVLDSFTRADESPLNATNWFLALGLFSIVSNKAVCAAAESIEEWVVSSFTANQEAWATVATKDPGSFNQAGVFLRGDGSTSNGYFFIYSDQSGTDQYRIYKRASGTDTQLGSSTVGPELTAGDKIGANAVGSTLSLFLFSSRAWNQTPLVTLTDSTYTGAGRIGIFGSGTVVALTNFGGGSIV